MKILSKKEKNNELLSRKEYLIDLEFEGVTPNKLKVKNEICKTLKLNKDLSVVRKIHVGFKSNIAKVEFFSYNDEKSMKRIENYLMHKKIEEKIKKEEEAKKQAEEEAKKQAEEEAKKQAEEEAKKQAEEEANKENTENKE